MKRALSTLLTAVLLLGLLLTPAQAEALELSGTGRGGTVRDGPSPLAAYFDESKVNPDYIQWMKDGRKGRAPSANDLSYLRASYAKLRARQNSALLPESYDLRERGLVEPVSDQGQLGVCWAIAANSAAAGSLMGQFPQASFSPIHTAWFARKGPQEEEAYPVGDPYNIGGADGIAVAVMAAWKGPVFSDKAPMVPDDQKDPDERLRYAADYHLQDAYYMATGIYGDDTPDLRVEDEITKQLLMDKGPVTIKYCANGENTYNEETSAWYNGEPIYADHAVLVVGWDDNYSKKNFCEGNQPENDGAWLIRNSWGTDWGDDGYFWLSYEDKSIDSGNAFLLEEKDNYTRNYQYDIAGWSYSLGASDNEEQAKKITAANIFTAEGNEMLEAVSFYTTDAGTEYSISIYTGVTEGQPQSGTLALEKQTGSEPYAGYHTIELNQPVELKKGQRFSIVVTLENPECETPLAIEWYVKKSPDDVPQYLGSGGESYVYYEDENGDWLWEDIAGDLDDALGVLYVTNVCIKGFTNPLPESGEAVPTVRFSEMAGPVKSGTEIRLDKKGDGEIYYSLDGTNYEKYSKPLELNFDKDILKHTISAYVLNNDKKGNTVTKTYTQASAQLTDLAIKGKDDLLHLDTSKLKHDVWRLNAVKSVEIMAQSGDTIKVNDTELKSGKWTEPVSLTAGETKELKVEVTGEGKLSTTYTISVYRSLLTFDYEKETIQFDDTKYTVTDADSNEIKNGASISSLIRDKEETELTVTPKGGGKSFKDYIPGRLILSDVEIDYLEESTDVSFSNVYAYSEDADMSNKTQCTDGGKIPVTPGKDVYIQRQPTAKDFAGNIFHLEVPDRPAAPKAEAAEITTSSVTLKAIEGALYSCEDGAWQESPEFTGLTPGKEYHFAVCLPATDTAFRSETGTAEITTYTRSSSSHSGGSTYPPAVERPSGGSVDVSPAKPKQGDTVTVIPKPEQGREVDTVTVIGPNGKPVEVTANSDGTYTFQQPSGKVKIEVTYKPAETPRPFPDVAESDWYHEAVRFVQENGLMNGYSDGRFAAHDSLSRAQLAQILFNKENRPAAETPTEFSDVPGDAWYAEAVQWVASQGIAGGYGSGQFGPNDPITREQLAVMLWRYVGSPAAADQEMLFSDADEISAYALEAMGWAVENGILGGYGDGRLGPQGQATRAQAAQMLKNFIENQEETP